MNELTDTYMIVWSRDRESYIVRDKNYEHLFTGTDEECEKFIEGRRTKHKEVPIPAIKIDDDTSTCGKCGEIVYQAFEIYCTNYCSHCGHKIDRNY